MRKIFITVFVSYFHFAIMPVCLCFAGAAFSCYVHFAVRLETSGYEFGVTLLYPCVHPFHAPLCANLSDP